MTLNSHTGDNPDKLLRQGQALHAEGSFLEARECYEAVLAVRPDEYVAHLRMGGLAQTLGDVMLSEHHLRRALALKPGSLDAQGEFGVLDWLRFDDAGAVARLTPVCQAMPNRFQLASYLAESLAALGQEDRVADVFEAALRAGAPWTVDALLPIAREINLIPACRRALFEAASRVTQGPIAQALAGRIESSEPTVMAGAPEPWRSLLAMPAPRRVSACMIVKNEAAVLGRLLDSIRVAVDEVVVLDTGSTDETIAIAESYGARVHHFTWCNDFAAARNESLKYATGDWILMVDADHQLDVSSRRMLRRIVQNLPETEDAPKVYGVQILEHSAEDPAVVSSRSMFLGLFRRLPYLAFVGALHEQLTDTRPGAERLRMPTLANIIYHHDGYSPAAMARQNKQERNMNILRHDVEERSDDAFVRFNYAQQLAAEKRFDEAYDQIRECLRLRDLHGADGPYLATAYMLYSSLVLRRRQYDELAAVCEAGLKLVPACADLLARYGIALLATNRTQEAIAPLQTARSQHGAIGEMGSDVMYTTCVPESLLAIAHWKLGDAARCDQHLKQALQVSQNVQRTLERFVSYCHVLLGDRQMAPKLLARVGVTLELSPKAPSR